MRGRLASDIAYDLKEYYEDCTSNSWDDNDHSGDQNEFTDPFGHHVLDNCRQIMSTMALPSRLLSSYRGQARESSEDSHSITGHNCQDRANLLIMMTSS